MCAYRLLVWALAPIVRHLLGVDEWDRTVAEQVARLKNEQGLMPGQGLSLA